MINSVRPFAIRHRKGVALAASLGLHLGVIALFFLPTSGALSPPGQTQTGIEAQEGVDLTLFRPEATGIDTSRPRPATNPVDNFRDMPEAPAQMSWQQAKPLKSAGTLSEIFGKDVFDEAPKAAQTKAPSDSEAHIKTGDQDRKTLNDLWRAIAPCWKRVADKNTAGVTLTVSFSPLGNLSKPPVIVRQPGTALDDRRLRSESLAITALSQCGPYPMALGQSDVAISFPAGG